MILVVANFFRRRWIFDSSLCFYFGRKIDERAILFHKAKKGNALYIFFCILLAKATMDLMVLLPI